MRITLEEIKMARAKISPGRWEVVRIAGNLVNIVSDKEGWIITEAPNPQDAEFIARCPEYVDWLIARNALLDKALGAATETIKWLTPKPKEECPHIDTRGTATNPDGIHLTFGEDE